MKLDIYNLQGKKTGDVAVDEQVFGVEPNPELIGEVFVAMSANQRRGLSHTKTVGARRGSTRKPWKQKGTGRARTGSVRNPIWRKGGVIFGPTKEQNFSKKVNKKVVKKAFLMALSGKVADKKLIVVDELKPEDSKTKLFDQALGKLKIDKKVLVGHLAEESDVVRLSKNIPLVTNELVANVDVLGLLSSTYLLVSKNGLEAIQARCKAEKPKEAAEKKATKSKPKKK